MKKILALLFALVLVFSLSSCGSKLIPIMAESDSKDGYFLDINCSDIFSLDAGEIVECKVLYYVKEELVRTFPAFLSVTGMQSSVSEASSAYINEDGKSFYISLFAGGMVGSDFRYNFEKSQWDGF